MKYYKSIYTKDIYELDHEPKFGGYEEATAQDYLEWQIKVFGKIEYPLTKD